MEPEKISKNLFDQLDKLKSRFTEQIDASKTAAQRWAEIQAASNARLAQIKPKIKLNVGGKSFSSSKTTLLRFPLTVFSVMLSTSHWTPEDSVFFFDRNPHSFDHVLDYLSQGSIRLGILDESDVKALKSQLDFFCVPYVIDTTQKLIREPSNTEKRDESQNQRLSSANGFVYASHDGSNAPFQFRGNQLSPPHPQWQLMKDSFDILNNILLLDSHIAENSKEVTEKIARWSELKLKVQELAVAAKEQVKLEFRGTFFTTCKSTLMKTPWFEAQVSRWEPDEDSGAYFIDRNPRFVDFILDYLRNGSWSLDRFDKRLLPELEQELEYFNIESDVALAVNCHWDPNCVGQRVTLSEKNMLATMQGGGNDGWNSAVRGSSPVTYVKYQLVSTGNPNYTMIGLATATLQISGNNYSTCGCFIYTENGTRYGKGNIAPGFVALSAIVAGDFLEFQYDKTSGLVSAKKGSQARFVPVSIGFSGDLYPAIDFSAVGGSVRIVETRN